MNNKENKDIRLTKDDSFPKTPSPQIIDDSPLMTWKELLGNILIYLKKRRK